jgi:hypothetical protein
MLVMLMHMSWLILQVRRTGRAFPDKLGRSEQKSPLLGKLGEKLRK